MLQTLFGFGGRLTRIGFWEVVVSVLLLDVAAAVAGVTGLEHAFPDNQFVTGSTAYQIVSWSLFAAAVLSVWAIAAALAKRAHDLGHGAIFLIWLVVPVIGWLWLIWELGFQPGQNFRNRFGPPPLAHHREGDYIGAEHPLEVQPVANPQAPAAPQSQVDPREHGHGGGLFHRRPHRVVRTGPAVLDWTGAASEESAEAAAHSHYDAAEALVAASERWSRQAEPAAEPEPAPPPAPAPDPHQVAGHTFAPAAPSQPQAPAEPAVRDPFAAALGDPTRH